MKKTKRNLLVSALLTLSMALCLGFGLNNQVQTAYATGPDYLAGSELRIETLVSGTTYSTTFAGGKYLHLDPTSDYNHETNSISTNADMEYDETTGVL
ncbi:MAG: hypothetical protein J5836_00105, partial [Clostridia bacterium]|nr:hypothetical protein [Clostridia bacterium]